MATPTGASPAVTPPADMPRAGGTKAAAMGGDMGQMMKMMHPMMAARDGMGMPFEHVDARLSHLKSEIKITQAQSGLWNAYADAVRADAVAMKTMRETMGANARPATLPDRLAAQREMMTAFGVLLDHTATAAKPLYEALSSAQRKIIDHATTSPMGMM